MTDSNDTHPSDLGDGDMRNIKGKRKDGGDSSRDNPENHYKCVSCGDIVYMGSLEEVFYHEKIKHESRENRA